MWLLLVCGPRRWTSLADLRWGSGSTSSSTTPPQVQRAAVQMRSWLLYRCTDAQLAVGEAARGLAGELRAAACAGHLLPLTAVCLWPFPPPPSGADKAGSYEEGGESGSISTFATRRRRLSAAANGTITAWIYGERL